MWGDYFILRKMSVGSPKEDWEEDPGCTIHIISTPTRQLEWPILITSRLIFHTTQIELFSVGNQQWEVVSMQIGLQPKHDQVNQQLWATKDTRDLNDTGSPLGNSRETRTILLFPSVSQAHL